MRPACLSALVALLLACGPAPNPPFTEEGLGPAVRAAAGDYPLVAIRISAPDSAELVFVDSTLSAEGLHNETWMFGPATTEAEADGCPAPKVLGRKLARLVWRMGGKEAGLKMVAVQVRGVARERYTSIRMFYYPEQLEGPWVGDPEHS